MFLSGELNELNSQRLSMSLRKTSCTGKLCRASCCRCVAAQTVMQALTVEIEHFPVLTTSLIVIRLFFLYFKGESKNSQFVF